MKIPPLAKLAILPALEWTASSLLHTLRQSPEPELATSVYLAVPLGHSLVVELHSGDFDPSYQMAQYGYSAPEIKVIGDVDIALVNLNEILAPPIPQFDGVLVCTQQLGTVANRRDSRRAGQAELLHLAKSRLLHAMQHAPMTEETHEGGAQGLGEDDKFDQLIKLAENISPQFTSIPGRTHDRLKTAYNKLCENCRERGIHEIGAYGGEIKNQGKWKELFASLHIQNNLITTQCDLIMLLLELVKYHKPTLEWFVQLGAVTEVTPVFQTLLCGLLKRLLKFPMLRCVNFGELDTLLSPTHWESIIPFLLESNVLFFYVCCANAKHVFRAFQDNLEKASKRMAFYSDEAFFCQKTPMVLHLLGLYLHPNTGKYQPCGQGKIMRFLVEEVIFGGADLASAIEQWWEQKRYEKRIQKILNRKMALAAVEACERDNATQDLSSEIVFVPVD